MKLSRNKDKSGLEFSFESKPQENTRNALKQAGFRWSSRNQVWWRKENSSFTFEDGKVLQAAVESGTPFTAPDTKKTPRKSQSKKVVISKDAEYHALYEAAVAAGKKAADEKLAKLRGDGPMYEILENAHPSQVNDPENPGSRGVAAVMYDKTKPTRSLGFQLDSCGFGWVTILDCRKAFTKWVLNNVHHAYKQNGGHAWLNGGAGARIYADTFTRRQEMSVNGAFAHGFAEVLREAGIGANVTTRID